MNNKVRLGILLLILAVAGVAGSDSAKRAEIRDAPTYGPPNDWFTADVLRYLSFGVGAAGLALLVAGLQQQKTVVLLPPEQRWAQTGDVTPAHGDGGVAPQQYPTFAAMSQKPRSEEHI